MESTLVKREIIVKTTLAIRRKPGLVGLPGDDPTNYNIKIGSSYKGINHLSGLTRQEEQQYLPTILSVDPEDKFHWLEAVKNYWSSISVAVPSDEETGNKSLKGKVLNFKVAFTNEKAAESYKIASLEKKAEIMKDGHGIVIEGTSDYVLFRYCLVYGRVANTFDDIYKTPKIWFYLYSKDQEAKKEYNIFKLRNKATEAFLSIMTDEPIVNSILRMFGENPNNLDKFGNIADKHLILDKKIQAQPQVFLDFVKDKDLSIKAFIKAAVAKNVVYNPVSTDSYYYGADKDVLLGRTLLDAVLFLQSKEEKNVNIRDSIKAQLKNN